MTPERTATEGNAPMNSLIRDRYLGDTVSTGSPQTLLVRLYDRLVLDLEGAEQAIAGHRIEDANGFIGHAQDIILELRATLRVDAWDGGPALAQVYDFCWNQLVTANVTKDEAKVASVRSLLEPLRDAWRDAALELSSSEASGAYLSA